jgi:hypothetical protein
MSWIHSSEAVPAVAITISGDPPDATEVGEDVSMTITLEEPFADAPGQWTLRGESDLADASWTVTTIEQGRTIDTNEYGSATFQQDLDIENGATVVEITVEGSAPEMTEFNFDNVEAETFTVASVGRATGGNVNTIESWDVRRFTADSNEARQAIADAEEVVAESNSEEARSLLSDAKAFYANEDFERAIDNAEQAQETAEQATSSLPLIPIAGAVVVLIVVVAGALYYRKQQQSGYKLQ